MRPCCQFSLPGALCLWRPHQAEAITHQGRDQPTTHSHRTRPLHITPPYFTKKRKCPQCTLNDTLEGSVGKLPSLKTKASRQTQCRANAIVGPTSCQVFRCVPLLKGCVGGSQSSLCRGVLFLFVIHMHFDCDFASGSRQMAVTLTAKHTARTCAPHHFRRHIQHHLIPTLSIHLISRAPQLPL